jgi:hypothetical protein
MITNKIKRVITEKKNGQGDLIASLFVILALTLFVFFFINAIADVNTRIQMDQIARKYILRMEAEGKLTSDEMNDMKNELLSIPSVAEVTDGSDIDFSGSTTTAVGYGKTIILKIKCPAATTAYIQPSSDSTVIGGLKRNRDTAKTYVITKSSTAKY